MSFLNKLLALENHLQEGEEVLRFPRTLHNYLPWNKKKPFCYKAHKTKGGLYLVLPHNQNNSLFLDYPKKEFVENKSFHYPYPSVNLFYLEQVLTKREEGLSFASTISRAAVHPKSKTEIKISVSYGVTAEAVPIGLRIHYTMLLNQGHYKDILFEVSRNRSTGNISARGPYVTTNLSKKDVYPVNHDTTLENLVELITAPKLTPKQFTPLLTGAYVGLHTLH